MSLTWPHPLLVVPDAVCVVMCAIGAVTDLRSRRIPNWLTVGGMAAAVVLNGLLPVALGAERSALTLAVASLAGGALMLVVFGLLGAIHFVGMGDVKAMIAVGLLLRWPAALWALAYVTLAGGGIALGYALARGRLGAVLGNLGRIGRRTLLRDREAPQPELHRIPYGLAILVGAAWAALANYVPALRVG